MRLHAGSRPRVGDHRGDHRGYDPTSRLPTGTSQKNAPSQWGGTEQNPTPSQNRSGCDQLGGSCRICHVATAAAKRAVAAVPVANPIPCVVGASHSNC